MTAREDVQNHRKALRVRAGLTQSQLAAKAGVGDNTVWAAENGKSLTEDKLRAIADALGVNLGAYIDPEVAAPAPAESTR